MPMRMDDQALGGATQGSFVRTRVAAVAGDAGRWWIREAADAAANCTRRAHAVGDRG
jgi:hypothetical protein